MLLLHFQSPRVTPLTLGAPKHIKKPTAQHRNVDTIGFFTLNYFTASLRALPALNAGTFDAAILISAPV